MLKSLAGGALFGERWGPSPPSVVALHGWRRSHSDFAAVLGPTSGAATGCVAPDLPGFGGTPPPAEPWGSMEYAEQVAELIESSDGPGGPCVVLGHSLGGRVAVRLAASFPALVSGLVLTGAPILPRPGGATRSSFRYRTARRMAKVGLVSEARLERARQRYGSEDYRAAEGVMRDTLVRLVSEDYEHSIDSISCPVELVWGDDDNAAPLPIAKALAGRIDGAHLVVCAGAGHLTPISVPEELRQAVERCANRVAHSS
ncbi:MAG TPA: alpha/beta hydrolase [Acidimicrobiales bacterium]|nr:alpha/beta hydrolase [Acidimicrobiales bacterium]